MEEHLQQRLQCLACRGDLRFSSRDATCIACGRRYPIQNGTLICTDTTSQSSDRPVGDAFIFRIKTLFKRSNALYYALVRFIGPLFVGKSGVEAFAPLPERSVILNLGSGPKILGPHILNIDSEPFHGVGIAALATALPFKDGSVDAIICECVLEHVPNPIDVIQEIERVLKPNGGLYVSIPFLDPYHASPEDYYRWTTSGLRELLKNFHEEELRIGWGPTSTMTSVVSHWLGLLVSFGNPYVYQTVTLILMTILFPVRLLDVVLKYPTISTNIATGFYFIGKKK